VRRAWDEVAGTYAARRDPDVSRRGLDLARETVPTARLVHGEMSMLPFAADRFDGITAYHAVFHVERERHPVMYDEFAHTLRPGGRLLMTLPGGRFETVRRGWMGGRMFVSAPGRDGTFDHPRAAGFGDAETTTATDPLDSSTGFAVATLRGD